MPSSANRSTEARTKAEARFQVAERRKTDAEKVLSDLKTAKDAESAKTVRLRALRLAKEETDREIAANAPPPAATKRKKKAKTAPATAE